MDPRAHDLTHWRVFWSNAWLLGFAVCVSGLVALLSLTLPIFMLQVYDRVINARSENTLWVLASLAIFLLIGMGVLDYARKRILARFAARLQAQLEPHLVVSGAGQSGDSTGGGLGTSDIDALRSFAHSGGILTLVDALWVPLFVFVLFILSPVFGTLALAGCATLALLHYAEGWIAAYRWKLSGLASNGVRQISRSLSQKGLIQRGQLIGTSAAETFVAKRSDSRNAAVYASDISTAFRTSSATLKFILSILALALGAKLVLQSALTIGGMVASVVLLSRVFSPFQAFLQVMPGVKAARRNWANIGAALAEATAPGARAIIPDAASPALALDDVTITGEMEKTPVLRGITLDIPRREITEIVGPIASGKTLLAETLSGLRRPSDGKIAALGARYDALKGGALGEVVGYVPEIPVFFSGTIKENIAGFPGQLDRDAAQTAARLAGVDQAISALPRGYDTQIDEFGTPLSRGLRDLIALARALYSAPLVLICDEPSPTLIEAFDPQNSQEINAFFEKGGALVLLSRRPFHLSQSGVYFELSNKTLHRRHASPRVALVPAQSKATRP